MSIIINKPSTVTTDGVTMKGNGTSTSPLSTKLKTTLINLSAGNYNATEPGYYNNVSGSPSGQFRFPTNLNVNLFTGDQFTIVNSSSFKIQLFSSFYSIVYQGQTSGYFDIPAFCSVTFTFDTTNGVGNEVFRAATTNFLSNINIDLDSWGNDYIITEVLNYFRFYNNSTGYTIVLPDPQFYPGVQFTLINADTTGLGYSGSGYQPVNILGTTVTSIGSHRCHTLLSINNSWVIINIQN